MTSTPPSTTPPPSKKRNKLVVIWTWACIGLLVVRFYDWGGYEMYSRRTPDRLMTLALETTALWALVLVGNAAARYFAKRQP